MQFRTLPNVLRRDANGSGLSERLVINVRSARKDLSRSPGSCCGHTAGTRARKATFTDYFLRLFHWGNGVFQGNPGSTWESECEGRPKNPFAGEPIQGHEKSVEPSKNSKWLTKSITIKYNKSPFKVVALELDKFTGGHPPGPRPRGPTWQEKPSLSSVISQSSFWQALTVFGQLFVVKPVSWEEASSFLFNVNFYLRDRH